MGHKDKGLRNYNPSIAAQDSKHGKAYLDKIKKLSPYERFLYTITERHRIHVERFPEEFVLDDDGDYACESTDPPWTEDPIMQTIFICNPYNRQNDRVSRWLLDHYILPNKDKKSVLLGTIYLRWYNYIPTMQKLIDLEVPQRLDKLKQGTKALQTSVDVLVADRDHGEQLFGGAYIIRPIVDGEKGARKVESIAQLMQRMLEDEYLYDELCGDDISPDGPYDFPQRKLLGLGSVTFDAKPGTMAYAFARLNTFSGMGKFYCYQFIGDLAHTHILRDAPDWWTWSFVGPGTARGLVRLSSPSGAARIHGDKILPRMMKYSPGMADQLIELQQQVNKDLGLKMTPKTKQQAMSGKEIRDMVPFSMLNLTNALCEYDKYERALYRERSIKRPYNGQG